MNVLTSKNEIDIMSLDWIKSEEDALIYIGDTMCSWCHGFSPELDKLQNNHPELNLVLVMGGLRPYNTEKAIDMADFLRSHWVEINERTGQPFSYDILDDPDFIYDTEPASRAVVVARMMKAEIEYDFFKAVQHAFYADNKNTNQLATYTEIAHNFGLDIEAYRNLFNSEEAKLATRTDFRISQDMGIKGFPSLVLKHKGKFTQIAHGYTPVERIEEVISNVKAELAEG